MHDFPIDPTPDTLSFFVVYMCHHIEPRSVDSYLSGIANLLEPSFPMVRQVRKSVLVQRTLKGCKRLYSSAIKRKLPLPPSILRRATSSLTANSSHDDVLFVAILLTGFHGLFRLGELVLPDKKELQNWRKVTRRYTVTFVDGGYSFLLPTHKADPAFEGNRPVLRRHPLLDEAIDPLPVFRRYLRLRDKAFPLLSELWIMSTGCPPTRSWFLARFCRLCPSHEFGGHSLRAGGATALADVGVPLSLIQAAGRWSSDSFQVYIRKHPVLMQAFLHRQASL